LVKARPNTLKIRNIVAGTIPRDSGLRKLKSIICYICGSPAGVPFLLISFPNNPALSVNTLIKGIKYEVNK